MSKDIHGADRAAYDVAAKDLGATLDYSATIQKGDLFLLRNILGQVYLLECTGTEDVLGEQCILTETGRVIETLCVKVIAD